MHVAITGCGWVTPLAAGDIPTVLTAATRRGPLAAGSQHYERISPELLAPFANLPAEAAKEDAVRLAAIALELAWTNAGLSKESYPSDRKGLVLGSALAGVTGMIDFANDVREQSPRFVSPIRFPQTVGNYICGALARCYDFRGPASTLACGFASSLEAIREGAALLESNQADAVVAGGSEMLNTKLVEGLGPAEVPFADGACFFVMERDSAVANRGGRILAQFGDSGPSSHNPGTLRSVAGLHDPDALEIEQWVGRTLGADGSAALAAGIGALCGDFPAGKGDGANKPGAQELLVRAPDTSGRFHELRFSIASA